MKLHVFLEKVQVMENSSPSMNNFSQRQRPCHYRENKETNQPTKKTCNFFTVCTGLSSGLGQHKSSLKKEQCRAETGRRKRYDNVPTGYTRTMLEMFYIRIFKCQAVTKTQEKE